MSLSQPFESELKLHIYKRNWKNNKRKDSEKQKSGGKQKYRSENKHCRWEENPEDVQGESTSGTRGKQARHRKATGERFARVRIGKARCAHTGRVRPRIKLKELSTE